MVLLKGVLLSGAWSPETKVCVLSKLSAIGLSLCWAPQSQGWGHRPPVPMHIPLCTRTHISLSISVCMCSNPGFTCTLPIQHQQGSLESPCFIILPVFLTEIWLPLSTVHVPLLYPPRQPRTCQAPSHLPSPHLSPLRVFSVLAYTKLKFPWG